MNLLAIFCGSVNASAGNSANARRSAAATSSPGADSRMWRSMASYSVCTRCVDRGRAWSKIVWASWSLRRSASRMCSIARRRTWDSFSSPTMVAHQSRTSCRSASRTLPRRITVANQCRATSVGSAKASTGNEPSVFTNAWCNSSMALSPVPASSLRRCSQSATVRRFAFNRRSRIRLWISCSSRNRLPSKLLRHCANNSRCFAASSGALWRGCNPEAGAVSGAASGDGAAAASAPVGATPSSAAGVVGAGSGGRETVGCSGASAAPAGSGPAGSACWGVASFLGPCLCFSADTDGGFALCALLSCCLWLRRYLRFGTGRGCARWCFGCGCSSRRGGLVAQCAEQLPRKWLQLGVYLLPLPFTR
jgi:hypothetical protein